MVKKPRFGSIGIAFLLLMSCSGGDGQIDDTSVEPEARSFYMGFTPFPHAFSVAAVEAAYDVISRDADMIVQHFDDGIPWQEALDNAGNATIYRDTYAANYLSDLNYKLQHNPSGHILYLAVTPLGPLREELALHRGNNANEPLTSPWDSYSLDHPDVAKAYIRHCLNMIEHFDPDYFAYAIEANMLAFYDQLNGTNKWAQFVNLVKDVYPAIKLEYPDFPFLCHLQKILLRLIFLFLKSYIQEVKILTFGQTCRKYPLFFLKKNLALRLTV